MQYVILLLLSIAMSAFAAADERPNIVVILCDDLGYGDIGCYGNTTIRTPHLDKLAGQGMRFTDFYSAAPVCSPARVGLLTGRTPNRAGVYDWIPGGREVHMRADEFTIPAMLKASGYATCMAGKWHCNGKFNTDQQPQPGDFGFDHWFATQNNAAPTHQNPKNFVRNGKAVGAIEGFSCGIVADEACQWISEHVSKNPDTPFFAYVAFHEPHEPIASPAALAAGYPQAKKRGEALYYANVENMDAAVGKITGLLDRRDLAENTLVIFTSDNGPETLNRYRSAWRSHGTPGPLRGMKLHTHEAGIRVCGIARWPLQIKAGEVCRQPAGAVDLLPTIANLAAGEIPLDRKLDGTDILALMTGGEVSRKQPLFWCYYSSLNTAQVAMRDGEWKLLARPALSSKIGSLTKANREAVGGAALEDFELYHISVDSGESENLAASMPDRVAAMAGPMRELYRSVAEEAVVWK